MPQCVGTTAKGKGCRVSGTYHCAQCDAYLCANHLRWAQDFTGPHCPWCDVVMKQWYFDGWATWGQGQVKRVGRGLYYLGEAGLAALLEHAHENVDRDGSATN
jgi:hypothetical protein